MKKHLLKNWLFFTCFYGKEFQANRFKHAYIFNPYGLTFWDYWNQNFKGKQDVLTTVRKYKGKMAFLKEWVLIYKYRS